jgi:hypothetical protein
MRKRAPFALATMQVVIGAALLYWDNIATKQALDTSGAVSLPHYWSLAGGLLLILDFPAVALTLLFELPVFVLSLRRGGTPVENELLEDVAFLCAVFFLWMWIGFLVRRSRSLRGSSPPGPEMAVYLSLVYAFGFCILMGMQASRTLTFLVAAFWSVLALLIYLKRSWAAKNFTG